MEKPEEILKLEKELDIIFFEVALKYISKISKQRDTSNKP